MDVGYSVWFFSLWGWNGVWFVALQDLTPVSHDVRCPLFLFLVVWLVSSTTFFSLPFLLGAGEAGFGIPLVFLRHGSALRPRSVRLHFLLHQGSYPALFFFFVGARVGVLLVFCRSTWLSVLVFVWVVSGFLSWSSLLRCMQDVTNALLGKSRETRHLPPFFRFMIIAIFGV